MSLTKTKTPLPRVVFDTLYALMYDNIWFFGVNQTVKVRDFVYDRLKLIFRIFSFLGSVGDLFLVCFKGVDVGRHGTSMSNELKLFHVCRVDSVS